MKQDQTLNMVVTFCSVKRNERLLCCDWLASITKKFQSLVALIFLLPRLFFPHKRGFFDQRPFSAPRFRLFPPSHPSIHQQQPYTLHIVSLYSSYLSFVISFHIHPIIPFSSPFLPFSSPVVFLAF